MGHVTLENPHAHLLLGQLAVGLKDRQLLAEAKAFLEFLELDKWAHKLDQMAQSGSPDIAVHA